LVTHKHILRGQNENDGTFSPVSARLVAIFRASTTHTEYQQLGVI